METNKYETNRQKQVQFIEADVCILNLANINIYISSPNFGI